tara:strand:- start:4236 stop:4751 length:516 start_codon:yes stop_codon:yes gene_type:complete
MSARYFEELEKIINDEEFHKDITLYERCPDDAYMFQRSEFSHVSDDLADDTRYYMRKKSFMYSIPKTSVVFYFNYFHRARTTVTSGLNGYSFLFPSGDEKARSEKLLSLLNKLAPYTKGSFFIISPYTTSASIEIYFERPENVSTWEMYFYQNDKEFTDVGTTQILATDQA